MGRVNAVFDGAIVAEPERVANGKGLQFPVYVRDQNKNRDTGNYEDSGDTTKIRVTLWGDVADEFAGEIGKGDIVSVDASLVEREGEKRDGSGKWRSLQTKFVNSVTIIKSASEMAPQASAPAEAGGFSEDGFVPAGFDSV